jgi:hypothetical protein
MSDAILFDRDDVQRLESLDERPPASDRPSAREENHDEHDQRDDQQEPKQIRDPDTAAYGEQD